jgi:colanic acid/amylovoran biosynthesis glycosyltransferase
MEREEHQRTYALRPLDLRTLVSAHLAALRLTPVSYLKTLLRSLRLRRLSPRATLWQLFYFLEAVPLWLQIRRSGVRHVHAHFTNPAADVAMIVADLGDARGSWTWSFSAHGADIQETDQKALAAKVQRADRVICVSDFGRSQLMTLVGPEHWPKLMVVHCGVDLQRFRGAPTSHADAAPLRILNVARLVPVKGQLVLLQAAALARQRALELELTIVGDGPLRASLEQAAHTLSLEDCVQFAGALGQDEIRDCYARADLFCLPSLREGIPVVLMEAMASGVPVVASGIMGIPELVEHGRSGVLVPPGQPEALADAMIRLAGDSEARHRLGDAGRAKIATAYEVRRSARQLASVFETVLGSRI